MIELQQEPLGGCGVESLRPLGDEGARRLEADAAGRRRECAGAEDAAVRLPRIAIQMVVTRRQRQRDADAKEQRGRGNAAQR